MFIRAFGDGFRAVVVCWTVSTASAAESFRSRCGSVRRAPVCSSHASPVAALHVGQGTDNICFGSEFFGFHCQIVQRFAAARMLNIAHSQQVGGGGRLHSTRWRLLLILCKSAHFFVIPILAQ